MTTNIDLTGNTVYVDDVIASGGSLSDAGNILVGAAITSAGENISIAADDTLVEALQAIANVADPGSG